MAEAVDVAVTLGWWLVGWIVVLGAAATVVLLAGSAVGAWAVRGAWRWLGAPLAAVRALRAYRCHPERYRPPPRPSWAAA